MERLKRELKDWGGTVVVAVLLYLGFNTFAFAAYHVPSESMLPTIRVGDHFFAAKYAYGYSRFSPLVPLPLGEAKGDGRLFGSLPERGDIVVFRHPRRGDDLVKRVIGLPGDRIQVSGGRLYINDTLVPREEVRRYRYRDAGGQVAEAVEYRETLPGGRSHLILEWTDTGFFDDTQAYTVPEGHFFAMGDNRDNSTDSRYLGDVGYVPVERLLGRADLVAFSWSGCTVESGLECPGGTWGDRLLRGLE